MAQPTSHHHLPHPARLDETASVARGGQLSALAAHVHSALAELALLAAACDACEGWAAAGIRSCSHWLAINASLDGRTSSVRVRVGHALAEPRAPTPPTWPGSAASAGARLTPGHGRDDRLRARRGLWTRTTESDILRLVALLPPEDGAVVMAALEAVVTSEALPGPDPAEEPWAAAQSDALEAVASPQAGSSFSTRWRPVPTVWSAVPPRSRWWSAWTWGC